MAAFRSIAQASMLSMLAPRHDLSLGHAVAREFVGVHHARYDALLLEQLAQEALGGFGIASALHQDVKDDTVLVDSTPEPMFPTGVADLHLIEKLLVSRCRPTAADLIGKTLAELQRPLAHRLMAYLDASGGEHLLHHAQAKRKPEVQPDGIADHFRRKTVMGIAGIPGHLHSAPSPRSGHLPVNLTVPCILRRCTPRYRSEARNR